MRVLSVFPHESSFFCLSVRVLGVFTHGLYFILLLVRAWGGGISVRRDVRRRVGEWFFRIFVQDSDGDGVIMSAVGNNGN